jgi:hypothetical protein
MSRRSIGNDRYRVEQKGSTRKSASAAKPKRGAGEAASGTTTKKKSKKAPGKRRFFGMDTTREPSVRVEPTPEMKKLRRWWWILMGAAIVIAIAMVPANSLKNRTLDSVMFGVYAAALGGALYLEFGPLRKARLAAIDASKAKGGKGKKAAAKDADGDKVAAKETGAKSVDAPSGDAAKDAD